MSARYTHCTRLYICKICHFGSQTKAFYWCHKKNAHKARTARLFTSGMPSVDFNGADCEYGVMFNGSIDAVIASGKHYTITFKINSVAHFLIVKYVKMWAIKIWLGEGRGAYGHVAPLYPSRSTSYWYYWLSLWTVTTEFDLLLLLLTLTALMTYIDN